MTKTRYAIVLVVAVVATAGFLGTSAFTSASLDRSVSVDVVQDNEGPLALSPDADSEFVGYDGDGALSIDLDDSATASGVNPDAVYTIGDASNASSQNAFTITNQDNREHTVSLNEDINGVDFTLVQDGSTVGDTSGGSVSTPVSSGSSVYVVMEFDTTDMTDGDTINGTLSVDA